MGDAYLDFLRAKVPAATRAGFDVRDDEINPLLKPHQRAMVRWACAGGRRAIFAAFGLGKSVIQLEILRLVVKQAGGRALVVAPLGVRQEFRRDAAMLGIDLRFIRSIDEAGADGLYLTNYETIRDGKLDPAAFTAVSLDEASCLRGFGGTKTFREFMRLFPGVRYRFVATATPAPNEFIELLAYAAFLDIMDVGQAKTRFFKRNSEKADELTLHPHKEAEFWLWVSTWGLFVQRPSDLGFSDAGYEFPPIEVVWHEIPSQQPVTADKHGQFSMVPVDAVGIVGAAAEKRTSLQARVDKAAALLAERPDEHCILWHDLEDERRAIARAVPDARAVYGSQDLDEREQTIIDFSEGRFRTLSAKPVIAGSGCNFQRHCAWAVFVGIGFKFNDFIQAIHRIQRFLQHRPVRIDLIYTSAEREVRRALEAKWRRHEELCANMTAIIKKYGLSDAAMAEALTRTLGVDRVEVRGEGYRLVNNDCVMELRNKSGNSVDLIATSIPFSTQYEYSPNYADFGHTDDNAHFWQQMGFLVTELFRVLKPGRVAAIHVKDRIIPGGMTGLGFQTVYPFADDCRRSFMAAGFAYLGEKTNLTDVVRENNQTYRLGHSEQLKDGSRMGAGLPEKVLLFRKPPTDSSDGYADTPVGKPRPQYMDRDGNVVAYSRKDEQAGRIRPVPGTGYSRARWQVDAHHLMRSSGDRHIKPEEWAGFDAETIYRMWREWSLLEVYDFEHHVLIGETLEAKGKLPPTFMLLPPHSWHDDVWSDVAQMRSLNTLQAQTGAERHLCPLPFDIVNRLITQFSMPGEVVLDPFGGLMTVPYCALKLGRRAMGIELSPGYFLDGVKHVEAVVREKPMPSLFDVLAADAAGQAVAAE